MTERAAGGGKDRIEHFVSTEPFDPHSIEAMSPEQERFYMASQWRMMWWKLRRHRLAVVSGVIILIMYGSILVSEFIAPYHLHTRDTGFIYAPPQALHLFHEGEFVGPFVYGFAFKLNMENLQREYTPDPAKIQPLRFFCMGDSFSFLGRDRGALPSRVSGRGRYALSPRHRPPRARHVLAHHLRHPHLAHRWPDRHHHQLSLRHYPRRLAGYYGGWVDNVVQRSIEVIRSFPELPLWMALSAALPVTWSPILVYLGITVILGLLDWTGLARAVRSKLLALREEDFATAAVLLGARPRRVIGRHLLPSFMSHLIASATLSIPSMILGETALSFLGLGLRPPITSWGVLLNEAQNINVVALYPWLMLPVVPVIVIVLALNFFGDGLRDAADPYK